MSQTLTISNAILSLRGRMPITDRSGNMVYEAKGELALFSPTWRLQEAGGEAAAIRRKIFAWRPTWLIGGKLGSFIICRKLFSWTRRYQILGGPFDGTEMHGNIWDSKFRITRNNADIARATGKILSLSDRHEIEVLKTDAESLLLTAISMVVLLMERRGENSD